MAGAKQKLSVADDNWPDSAFWTFSTDLYDRPGIEAACLALQDRYDLNVNLLLWALWLAECGVVLDQPTLERAKALVAPWQKDVIGPLRTVRKRLRFQNEQASSEEIAGQWPDQVQSARLRIVALELDCEHLSQLALGHLGDELKPSRRADAKLAGDNLICIQLFKERDRGDLTNLLKQVFPEAHHAHLSGVLDALFNAV